MPQTEHVYTYILIAKNIAFPVVAYVHIVYYTYLCKLTIPIIQKVWAMRCFF